MNHLLAQIVWPTWGVIVFSILLYFHGVVIAGKWRRKQWSKRVAHLTQGPNGSSKADLDAALKSERASDFLNLLLRRLYYSVAGIAALVLILSPLFHIEPAALSRLRIALTVTSGGAALLLLWYWRGWDDHRDRLAREAMRRAREYYAASRGLNVRDKLTGVYSEEFWLHLVSTHLSTRRSHAVPLTCLVLELQGTSDYRRRYGQKELDLALTRLAEALTKSVRSSDAVCRYAEARYGVALFKAPEAHQHSIVKRVISSLDYLVLRRLPDHQLHISASAGTLPDEAQTPIELLHLVDRRLSESAPAAAYPADHLVFPKPSHAQVVQESIQ